MMPESPSKKKVADLEKLYSESESCDTTIFSEMRSNLLLIAGEHYNKAQSAFWRRIRDSKQINEQQKLRLTKNHIQKITKIYANNIIAAAPGVGFSPKNEGVLQDEKSAELHHAVWQDAKEKYDIDEKIDEWCDDFIGIGECATKIFWDPNKGKIKAYEQGTDESGNPLFLDPMGRETVMPFNPETGEPFEMKPGKPVYSGEFVFETIYGFNLLRAPEAKRMDESPYLIVRKMMNKDSLIEKYPDFKEKITSSADNTMVVFDPTRGGYQKSNNQVMVKEYYFRPTGDMPKGMFYIATKDVILETGELPGGIFPIVVEAFEKIQTTPRGRSAVKQMRPYQAEINRSASKIAEHQITLGDDKIIMQNGSKISQGAALPGVRALTVTGQVPTILAGRDGSQYLSYMQAQIAELYSVMGIPEITEDAAQLDPYAMLFRAASQKKQFQRNIKRFERFLCKVAKVYVQLAKIHLPDESWIYAVGRKELINVAEFKKEGDLCYTIKVSPQSDDIETKLGKQIVLNHLVQYTGANLSKEDIGKLVRLMPYANLEEGLSDLTIEYDSATNDILAMDRGEVPTINQYDNHVYCIKRAVLRMRQPDFKNIDPKIQQIYQLYVQQHEQAEAQRQAQITAAASERIPTDGYMITLSNMTVPDPKDPSNNIRVRLPYAAIQWLIQRLEAQGQSLGQLESMNQGAIAEMAQMLSNSQAQGQQGDLPNQSMQ